MFGQTDQCIGVYDSGVGGLTVLKALIQHLPHENFVYFADTINLPYGNKTPEQICDYSSHIIGWMQNQKHAKLAVAACHTSSALALDVIGKNFSIPIVGTINPLVNYLLNNPTHKNLGIIATPASANSNMHQKILKQNGFQGKIHTVGCPEFVPMIEQGHLKDDNLKEYAKDYIAQLMSHIGDMDTLIYGCTHYPFIQPLIQTITPQHIFHLNPADIIALEVKKYLAENNLQNHRKEPGTIQFFSSHDQEGFLRKVNRLMIC